METTQQQFDDWAARLRVEHPEMFDSAEPRRPGARYRWHPLFQRVYGIRPWQLHRYTLREYALLVEDLETHGVGLG